MAGLIERLLSEQHGFNFFQAVALLEEWFAREGSLRPIETGKIRFTPDTNITFPPNDIASIQEKDGEISFLLSFMGLVGVSSPLPNYFSEYLNVFPDNRAALLDFVTIFNHRMYALFYQAWKKYHIMRNVSSFGTDSFTAKIAALCGKNALNSSETRSRMMAYAGILAGQGRSAAGLQTLISDWFDHIPIQIQEFTPRWAPLQNVNGLGKAQLGIDALAGTSVYDLSGKFTIVIGPLKREPYETFLPGSENITIVKTLARSFLIDPLSFDIEVQLQSEDLTPIILGLDNTRLGETSSLGKSSGKSHVHSMVIEGE